LLLYSPSAISDIRKQLCEIRKLAFRKRDYKFVKLLPEKLWNYRVHWLGQGRLRGSSGRMNIKPCEPPNPLEEIETNIRAITEAILKLEKGGVMMNTQIKDMYLDEELRLSQKLIITGLGELQEINMGNDFYHLPHLLLSSGLERFMKCYICLVYEARKKKYPDSNMLRNLGHDLSKLNEEIINNYFAEGNRPELKEDLVFLKEDGKLKIILKILSEFGKYARYYNLDIVTGKSVQPSFNPKDEWERLERSIEDPTPYLTLNNQEGLYNDYYPRVNSQIIAIIERFVRAITRQFTLGGHGKKLSQYYIPFSPFLGMMDKDLGTKDYRRSVQVLQRKKEEWIKRTEEEVKKSPWPTKEIFKKQFSGDWPFRSDKAIVELRDRFFCVINIEGYDFALNGAAKSRFNLPYPHDAGLAILGKSIGPFIDLTLNLGKNIK
jgi:hypothetical protein